jgi:hypothetical protein
MSHLHGARSRLLLISTGCLLACLTLLASTAHAEFGEETRFGFAGTAEGDLTNKCAIAETSRGGCARAIGVDPRDNSVYILDEPKEEEEKKGESIRHFRLQKFKANTQGAYELAASATFTETSPPLEEEGAVEGIAFDESENRVYVLAVDVREAGRIDSIGEIPGNTREALVPVASTLYAFSTKESGKALVGAGTGGPNQEVLLTPEQLGAQSETRGQALLEPHGITVDPKTNEVIILAHEDHSDPSGTVDNIGNTEDHFVLQRVLPNGTLGARYRDSTNVLKHTLESDDAPNSPIVVKSAEGAEQVYVNLPGVGIEQIPYEFTSSAPPTTVAAEPAGGAVGMENLTSDGGGLTASPEGGIDGVASVENEAEKSDYYGAYELSLSGQPQLRWTGGQSPEGTKEDKCVLEPGVEEVTVPVLAAGSDGKLFVLASEFLFIGQGRGEEEEPAYERPFFPAVIELGPSAPEGKGGCPHASAAAPVAEVNGTPLKEGETVNTGVNVVFSSKVKQADALDVKWAFVNEATKEEEVVAGDEFQAAKVKHSFSKPGTWTITETIESDDLATPTITEASKLTVEPSPPTAAIKVTPSTIKVNEVVTFNGGESKDPNGQPLEYKWTIDGVEEKPSSTPTIAHTFTTATKHKVRLVVTDAQYKLSGETSLEFEVKAAEAKKEEPKKEENNTGSGGSGGGGSGGGGTPEAPKAEVKGIAETHPVPPDATIAGTSLTVSSSGTLSVKVSCPAGESVCSGTVTLRTLGAVTARAAAHKRKTKASVLTLAAGSFTVAGGQVKAITLHLSSAARALLARSHVLRIRATVVAHDPTGATDTTQVTVTLSPAKSHGHSKH